MAKRSQATQKPPEPKYLFAPGLPRRARLLLAGAALLGGAALQLLVAGLLGTLVYVVGVGLLILRSVSSAKAPVSRERKWERVTLDEVKRIAALHGQAQEAKRRASRFGLGCGWGCLGFLGYLVLVGGVTVGLYEVGGPSPLAVRDQFWALLGMRPAMDSLLAVWLVDSLLLLIPFWLSGWALVWEPPQIALKLEPLLNVYRELQRDPKMPLQCVPMLELSGKEAQRTPTDCRLLFELTGAPPEFIGVQTQVSLNSVQGTAYPYLYCVVLARPAFGLAAFAEKRAEPPPAASRAFWKTQTAQEKKEAKFRRYQGEIMEIESGGEVDVVVIRQVASGTGYHTDAPAQVRVWRNAVRFAQEALAAHTPAPTAPPAGGAQAGAQQ